jgi:hypothetical protein
MRPLVLPIGGAQAFLRRLCWTAGSSFPLRPPDTGRSNDGWRRAATASARFSAFVPSLFAGASCARLRFKAAIKSITGAGALTSRGLMGSRDDRRPALIDMRYNAVWQTAHNSAEKQK